MGRPEEVHQLASNSTVREPLDPHHSHQVNVFDPTPSKARAVPDFSAPAFAISDWRVSYGTEIV